MAKQMALSGKVLSVGFQSRGQFWCHIDELGDATKRMLLDPGRKYGDCTLKSYKARCLRMFAASLLQSKGVVYVWQRGTQNSMLSQFLTNPNVSKCNLVV